jgi:hypothetical protein
MNFDDYRPQIKELLIAKNAPNFADLFNKVFADESSSNKFLIKMELNRLSKPCQRIIDLRGKVQQKCNPFTYQNTLHYLDNDTKEAFENSIKIYGQYTIGTYEDVINHHLKKKKAQKKSQTSVTPDYLNKQCELILLSQRNKRAAPRMFFVSDIEIEFDDGKKEVAQTTNISISGLKIKLSKLIAINNKSIITISFLGFQKEYMGSKCLSNAQYQVVGQDTIETVQYLYLNYIDNNQDLINFIQEFIRVNQYKYKIDVHYYYQLAKNKLLTNYYLANTSKVVACLNQFSSSPFLFTLESKQNKEKLAYWTLQSKNNLHALFNQSRVLRLLDSSANLVTTTIYCFTHFKNGVSYFLSATEEELLEQEIKELFLLFGSNKKSWRVYNLAIIKYHHKSKNKNPGITEQKYELLDEITHIATLEDITQTPPISYCNSEKDANELNQFVHHENIENGPTTFQLFPMERRQEPRYLYKSNIILSFADNHYPAQIVNFSLSGLMIKLQVPLNIPKQSQLTINLIDLQKVSDKFSLSKLNYTRVNYGFGNTLHLQVADRESRQIAKNFFSLLIQFNPSHFQKMPLQKEQVPFSDELKKIEEASHLSCALFIEKEKHLFNVKYATINSQNKALKTLFTQLSDNPNELNVTPIINNQLYKRLISQPLNMAIEKHAVLKETFIYIKTKQSQGKKWKIKSFLDEDFKSPQERDDFIEYSRLNSQIYVLHYRLTSLERPDFSIVEHEINAISRFALHLTKKLKMELQTMSGLIEITDCSHLFRKASH